MRHNPPNVYGQAGVSLKAGKAIGNDAVRSIGARGEQQTAAILNEWAARTGGTVLHDLVIPNKGEEFNLDHLIVSGKTIALIDTKVWAPGLYWTTAGHTYRYGTFMTPNRSSARTKPDTQQPVNTRGKQFTITAVLAVAFAGASCLAATVSPMWWVVALVGALLTVSQCFLRDPKVQRFAPGDKQTILLGQRILRAGTQDRQSTSWTHRPLPRNARFTKGLIAVWPSKRGKPIDLRLQRFPGADSFPASELAKRLPRHARPADPAVVDCLVSYLSVNASRAR